jgi:enoyl-CoA hydratase/carnithine racemase
VFTTLALDLHPPTATIRLLPGASMYGSAWTFFDELSAVAESFADQHTVHAVLLEVEGDTLGRRHPYGPAPGGVLPFRCLELMPQPVLAVLDGAVEGAGLELALACDLRVASEGATFALPQLAAGAVPVFGATQRLPRLVGRARAAEMLLLGEVIDAGTALRWGLVNTVAPAASTRAEAERLAAAMCARGPLALRFAKEAVARGLDLPLAQALQYETDLTVILQTTADRAEGVRAFVEKRPPRFGGR